MDQSDEAAQGGNYAEAINLNQSDMSVQKRFENEIFSPFNLKNFGLC